jgi:hypothetical protein
VDLQEPVLDVVDDQAAEADPPAMIDVRLAGRYVGARLHLRRKARTRDQPERLQAGPTARVAAPASAASTRPRSCPEIARERVADGEFTTGDLEALDDTFDAVTGLNSFQYATNRQIATAGTPGRTARAPIAIVTWAVPERCKATFQLAALGPLLWPAPPDAAGPFALSAPGPLEKLATAANQTPNAADEVTANGATPSSTPRSARCSQQAPRSRRSKPPAKTRYEPRPGPRSRHSAINPAPTASAPRSST